MIEKKRGPEGVAGRWNGVGGKVEEGETPAEAMVRECFEETSLPSTPEGWVHFGVLHGDGLPAGSGWNV